MVFNRSSRKRIDHCQVYIDGASRGNPGPSAYAYVLVTSSGEKYIGSSYIGISTNNKAEYSALINSLIRAKKIGCRKLTIYSDSQLLVKQLNNEYAVRNPELRILYQKAKRLIANFGCVEIVYVPRDRNVEADALASAVLKRLKKVRNNS
ncbi:MAG: ribonuclease HI family protein [Nitrososphaerota archaeon]